MPEWSRSDEYFYIKHRNEPRGVGGIFFDDLTLQDFDTAFAVQQNLGDYFLSTYVPILERRKRNSMASFWWRRIRFDIRYTESVRY